MSLMFTSGSSINERSLKKSKCLVCFYLRHNAYEKESVDTSLSRDFVSFSYKPVCISLI